MNNNISINGETPVFGLDIGTRSVVGTVGYRQGDRFVVIAQEIREHQTRAMLDGQIHDINRVAATISDIKFAIQEKTGIKLEEVCIAAAGRVLKTMNVHVDMDFDKERNVTKEDINNLISLGVEKSFNEFQKNNDTDMHFYCVGHSVVKYYLNGLWMSQPEHHKAKNIGADMITTFLPDDVVDGLYSAVELAGLKVVNLTLEPIAAIRVAIPEKFRLLNIAMIDVGAGTSDISITNDGSVIAFGMLPHAGDCLTEVLAKTCLIDFATAEKLKTAATIQKTIVYEDIMGMEQTISAEEVVSICQPEIDKMAKMTAETIKELNGGNSPSAVFVVGGGGKIKGFTGKIAEELGLDPKRVALRGEEIMKDIDFPEGSLKDSTIITPIGICQSYYEHNNNFIYVTFNGSRVKLYDNNKLAVIDAAIQSSFSRENIFPKRGKSLHYTVNGKDRVSKGEYGESAKIYLNGETVNINTAIKSNDVITVEPSTVGNDAVIRISDLIDYNGKISLKLNGEDIQLPKPVKVNGAEQNAEYLIQEGYEVSLYSYLTYDNMTSYIDNYNDDCILYVNGERVSKAAGIYSGDVVEVKSKQELDALQAKKDAFFEAVKDHVAKNDSMTYAETEIKTSDVEAETKKIDDKEIESADTIDKELEKEIENKVDKNTSSDRPESQNITSSNTVDVFKSMIEDAAKEEKDEEEQIKKIIVIVNQRPIVMNGKSSYTFVDIFDYIDFDTRKMQGSGIATLVNGENAQYTQLLHNGDKVEVYWK